VEDAAHGVSVGGADRSTPAPTGFPGLGGEATQRVNDAVAPPPPQPSLVEGEGEEALTTCGFAREGRNGALGAVAHPSPSRCAGPALSLRGRGILGSVRRRPARTLRLFVPAAVGSSCAQKMAECARHAPGCSALRWVHFDGDSKNGVCGAGETCEYFVTI
jgi:hypothetical protein